jgi:hypothetical protein
MVIGSVSILLCVASSARAHPWAERAPGLLGTRGSRSLNTSDQVPDAEATGTSGGEDGVKQSPGVSPVLNYQGRLTDPTSGEPVADGSYTMVLRLYDVASGGTSLWAETKDVEVQGGIFSTALGDTKALDQSMFDGQTLWLGIKVGTDGEATPRQRLVPVAYALSLAPGALISTTSGSPALAVSNAGSGEALDLGGDLNVSGSMIGGHHTHSGVEITTGRVAEDRIAVEVARDSEVLPILLDADGAGSGLDADLVDGRDSDDFAATSHDHDARYYRQDQSDDRFINRAGPDAVSGSSPDPMLSVTQIGNGVAVVGHNFGEGDGVQGLADGNGTGVFGYSDGGYGGHFIGGFGEALHVDGWTTMNGNLTVSGSVEMGGALTISSEVEAERVTYHTPHTHTFAVGSEGFVPGSNVDYVNAYGNGGAYIEASGFHALVAPVHLPHKAVVTRFEVFFYDGSSNDMTVCLKQQNLWGGGYWDLAEVSSSGTSGYCSRIDEEIDSAVIDNTRYGYCVYAYTSAWDGDNLRIKGAVITYTISEAP